MMEKRGVVEGEDRQEKAAKDCIAEPCCGGGRCTTPGDDALSKMASAAAKKPGQADTSK